MFLPQPMSQHRTRLFMQASLLLAMVGFSIAACSGLRGPDTNRCKLRIGIVDSIAARVHATLVDVEASFQRRAVVPISGSEFLNAYFEDYTCFARLAGGAAASEALSRLESEMKTLNLNIKTIREDNNLISYSERITDLRQREEAHLANIEATIPQLRIAKQLEGGVVDQALPEAPGFIVSGIHTAIEAQLINAGLEWAQNIPAFITANDLTAVNGIRTRMGFFLDGTMSEWEMIKGIIEKGYLAGQNHIRTEQ